MVGASKVVVIGQLLKVVRDKTIATEAYQKHTVAPTIKPLGD
jgi:hypothetical protein